MKHDRSTDYPRCNKMCARLILGASPEQYGAGMRTWATNVAGQPRRTATAGAGSTAQAHGEPESRHAALFGAVARAGRR
jgi:hypothetical protein